MPIQLPIEFFSLAIVVAQSLFSTLAGLFHKNKSAESSGDNLRL
jgi:hypothetical protein